MIKNLTPRLYQQTIFANSTEKNTLVVLPTGMGKSIIFVMLIAHRLKLYPQSKIIILSPTKPLCEQHVNTITKFLNVNVELFTGSINPEKRAQLFKKTQVIVSTPQGLENDVISKRISFKNVSLIVFDECHRAVKDYSYVWLADFYMKHAEFPRILGLTASPGGDEKIIKEVIDNLFIEHLEVRNSEHPDVKNYIQKVKQEYIEIELTDELKNIQKYIKKFLKDGLKRLENLGMKIINPTKTNLLKGQANLRQKLSEGMDFGVLKSISVLAEIMKIQHALELLETQGIYALSEYFKKIKREAEKGSSKAVKNIVNNIDFRSASILTESLLEQGKEHPKFEILIKLVEKNKRIIIFNQFRDNAKHIEKVLKEKGINAKLFVGQTKKNGTGMSQKEQIETIKKFKEGKYSVLVMTSVGEEGLDIPSVDEVIFFEPVPSAIRHIQRKGRTGRLEKGKVKILVTKGTRDEISRWSSFHKEKKMYSELEKIKQTITQKIIQKDLSNFENFEVFVDHREKTSRVVKLLMEKGAKINLKQLEVADYIVNEEIGIEYKTTEDFVNSIIDGRLIEQIKDLKYNFKKPVIILEGDDLYGKRGIHPNSIRGMLISITTNFGIPIIPTKNPNDSAEMITLMAKKQEKSFSPNPTKRGLSLQEKQELFISALPDTGMKTSKLLLKEFNTPRNVVNASEDELKKIEGIGKEKARNLKKLFENEYSQ